MKLRYSVLLALLALIVASPVAAFSEGEIKDAGVPVEEGEIELEVEGEEAVAFLGSGVNCKGVQYSYVITNAKKVHVIDRVADTGKCTGFGTYQGCKVKDDKALGLPWEGDVTADGVTFKDAIIEYTFEGCNEPKVKLEVPFLPLKVDNKASITEFTLEVEGTAIFEESFEVPVEITGTYEMLSGAGTYEIE